MAKKKAKKAKIRGPKPDTLVIEGNWKEAVRKSFKKQPSTGQLAEARQSTET
jgi:hypothetical protein